MQHVRIGQDHMSAFACRLARIAGRIAVVGKNSKTIVEARRQIVQLGQLVLGQCLGREQVQRPRVGVFQNCVQYRQVVAQRFAGSRRRHHHEILAPTRHLRRRSLVRIELLDFLGAIGSHQLRPHPRRHRPVRRVARREVLRRRKHFIGSISRRKRDQRVLDRI